MTVRACDAAKATMTKASFARLPNHLRTNPGGAYDPEAARLSAEERGFRLRATLLAEFLRGPAPETRAVCVRLPFVAAPRFGAPAPVCRGFVGYGFERSVPARCLVAGRARRR